MRPKTRRRLLILAAITVVLVILAGAGFYVRRSVQYRRLLAARDRGLAAFALGKYDDAYGNLAEYLRPTSNRNDPDLVYKFALSHELATDGNREHLEVARNWFQMHLAMKPDSLDSRKHLLDIYPRLYPPRITEALKTAEEVFRLEPGNTTALRVMIECQVALGRTAAGLESAQKLAASAPEDIENTTRVFFLMRSLGRTAEILPFASQRYESRPDTAASEIIMSVAYSLVDELTLQQRAGAWALAERIDPGSEIRRRFDPNVSADSFGNRGAAVLFARKAAARPLGEGNLAVTRVIVSQLDRLGLIFDSLALLEKIDPAIDDPWVRGPVILRFWECNRFSEVNKRLDNFSPKQRLPEEIELLAIHAICLAQTGHADEATRIADGLAQMKASKMAAAWESVLRLQYLGGKGDLSALVHTVRNAIDSTRERSWPYLWASLGDAYAALGERDVATYAFARARDAAPLWFVPRLKLSRLLMDMGQPGAAAAEAEAARRVLPHALTQGNYLVVAASQTPAGANIDATIVRQVIELQKQYPGDESTLALYLYVLVQSNQKDVAQKVLREALANEKPLSLNTLIGLAVASRNAKLGLEGDCIDAALKKYGVTPELAMTQAAMLASVDKPVDVLSLYKQAREKNATPETDVAWRLGSARLLESLRDANAGKAWAELGDDPALKGNLMVQKAVLGAASARSDRPLLDRTIERLKTITGDDAAVWREARARVLIQERTPAAIAQARQLLDETIRLVPTSADAYLLLGALLESQGDIDGALKRFAEAARLRPNPGLVIQMAHLHLQRSEFGKARELLTGLSISQLEPAQKARAADIFEKLGDLARATAIAKDIDPAASTDPATALFLAQLDRKNGNSDKAESRLRELMKAPTLPVITYLADFYASTRRMEQARATLDQLQSLKLEPGQRELAEAEFLDRHGDPRAATEKFAGAAKAVPDDSSVQVAYISNLLRRGRFDDALAAATKASSSLPANVPLANFLKQQQALNTLKRFPETLAIGDAILHGHADSAAAAEALAILAASRNEPLSQTVSRLRPLADRSPLLAPLQLFVINGYRAMGQFGEAANLASRTAGSVPNAVDFARLAAQVQAEAGDWSQALVAAQAWKRLTPADTLEADLLCAEAYLRQSDYTAASKEMARYLEAAKKDPSRLGAVIHMQSRILIAGGDYVQASELLKPLLKDKVWRGHYYQFASLMITDADVAAKWYKDLAQAIPEDQIDERVNLAGGWIDTGVKRKREDFRIIGRDMLRSLLAANPTNVAVVYGSALFNAVDGDRNAADAGYRKTLALDAKHTFAMNNLAMLLAEDNRNLDEAAAFIAKAIEIQPSVPAYLDTQSYIEGLRKHRDTAIVAIQRAINIEPANPLWRLRKIELLLDFGDRDGASRAIGEIDQLNKKAFSDEIMERLQALRKKASGTSATLPTTR